MADLDIKDLDKRLAVHEKECAERWKTIFSRMEVQEKALGRIDDGRVAEHRRIVSSYGLPDSIPQKARKADLVSLMGRDKKAVGGLTFVLDGARGVELVSGVDPNLAQEVISTVL